MDYHLITAVAPTLPTGQSLYKAILDRINDGVYFVDAERRIVFWNDAASRLTGYKVNEVLGQCCPDGALCHVDDSGRILCADACPLSASLGDGQPHEVQVFLRHKDGHRVPVIARVEPIRADDGSIVGAVQIFTDDTARRAARRRAEDMERLAFLDHVTQLPNRRFLEMSLQTALTEYQLHRDPFGVLIIDLDRLKPINDQFGHVMGDRALKEVALTLVGALRPADIVGRWGGDEFVAIVRHVKIEILRGLAERCRAMAAKTSLATRGGESIFLSVSIGETLVRASDTAEKLIKRADDLMYQNKLSRAPARNGALVKTGLAARVRRMFKAGSTRLSDMSRFFFLRQQ